MKNLKLSLVIITVSLILLSCKNVNLKNIAINLFTDCQSDTSNTEYKTTNHELFSIETPTDWDIDNELKQGIDISSNNFADSLTRGFLLTVLPFEPYYFKKNSQINYYKFEEGRYKGNFATFYVRNDLYKRDSDSTVYWRAELKVLNKEEDTLYWMILGKRADQNKEPSWCEFQKIVESLEIKK